MIGDSSAPWIHGPSVLCSTAPYPSAPSCSFHSRSLQSKPSRTGSGFVVSSPQKLLDVPHGRMPSSRPAAPFFTSSCTTTISFCHYRDSSAAFNNKNNPASACVFGSVLFSSRTIQRQAWSWPGALHPQLLVPLLSKSTSIPPRSSCPNTSLTAILPVFPNSPEAFLSDVFRDLVRRSFPVFQLTQYSLQFLCWNHNSTSTVPTIQPSESSRHGRGPSGLQNWMEVLEEACENRFGILLFCDQTPV